ncbi:MAG: hypothetical protein JNK12_20200 [Acidimicrobiales bacterium]|nr:hypothetical protein [Acidimicrobiales bacterium]
MKHINRSHPTRPVLALGAVVFAAGLALAGCGSSSTPAGSASSPSTTATATSGADQVLPVTVNPITNTATAETLKITSVLVENNIDAAGQAVDDHLEIELKNTGSTDLANVEVFYTFTDPTAQTSESYYTRLPDTFTVPAGGTRIVHFDDTGAPDHFPVNKFSLYYTSTNALDVEVTVSADGAAVQTTTLQKDAGGAENPGE